MHAAAMRLELRVPDTHSLKEKRSKMRYLSTHLTKKFPVAVAEVGFQDQWQRASIGVVAVAAQAGQLQRVMHSVERAIGAREDFELLEVGVSYLEDPQ